MLFNQCCFDDFVILGGPAGRPAGFSAGRPKSRLREGGSYSFQDFSNFLHDLQSEEKNPEVQGFPDFPASVAGWPKSRLWEGGGFNMLVKRDF